MENFVQNQNDLPNVPYHSHNGVDSPSLWKTQEAIVKPTGGATVDAEARVAIDDIIDKLKLLGFTF